MLAASVRSNMEMPDLIARDHFSQAHRMAMASVCCWFRTQTPAMVKYTIQVIRQFHMYNMMDKYGLLYRIKYIPLNMIHMRKDIVVILLQHPIIMISYD